MPRGRSTALVALAILGVLVSAVGLELWWLGHGPVEPASAVLQQPVPGSPAPRADRAANPMTVEVLDDTGVAPQRDVESRSGDRRIRLQFRCQTLGNDVRKVWSHMGLTVQLEDEAGTRLAECAEPWLPNTVSIPADIQNIVCVARGYRRTVVPSPETFRDGLQPTVVSLQPDARVHLHARNLPSAPGDRYRISARLTGGDEGPRVLRSVRAGGGKAQGGELTANMEIPSGVATRFVVARTSRAPGDRTGLVDLTTDVVTLAPGEERHITLDLVDFGILEGRVTGLEPRALEHQVLSVQTDSGSTQAALDREGGFRIVGLSEAVSLALVTQGGAWPVLEAADGQRTWSPEGSVLVVEPEEPVHGVVPAREGRDLDLPFQVQLNGPPDGRQLSHKIPLFTRQLLDRVPLFFFVEGFGHFHRSLAGEEPDADGLYRVEVSTTAGDLVVRMLEPPDEGLHLFARPVDSKLGIAGIRSEDEWRFEGLAAGEYEIVVHFAQRGLVHSERRLDQTAVVRPRRQTTMTAKIPELVEIHGQVQNWTAIPLASRPHRLQVHHGDRPHTVQPKDDGSFHVTVLGPWDGVSKIAFFNPHWMTSVETSDITVLPGARLSVKLPNIRERRLSADPMAGGELSIQVRGTGGDGQHLRPESGNRFLITGAPGQIEGALLEEYRENGRSHRLLRGWFRLPGGGPDEVHLAPTGRWVQVVTTDRATLTVVPPAWWTHPPQPWDSVRLEDNETRRLWLPDRATAITVNGTELPVSQIGATLRVDP